MGETIYETLIEPRPTCHLPYLRPEHPAGRTPPHVPPTGNPVFQHWCPPRVGQAKSTMSRKRTALARALSEPSRRARPRRNARSTYATATEEPDIEEDAPEDQPMVTEEQPAPEPTPEQVLQQLQAQLQSTQQERDRLAATFAASQRAVPTSLQAAEIR